MMCLQRHHLYILVKRVAVDGKMFGNSQYNYEIRQHITVPVNTATKRNKDSITLCNGRQEQLANNRKREDGEERVLVRLNTSTRLG